MKMSYNKRDFDLDHLKVPFYHVVTGVHLCPDGSHLGLKIQGSKIDFRTGKLTPGSCTWFGHVPGGERRTQVYFPHEPDIPTKFTGYNPVLSSDNQFLRFDTTSALRDVILRC